MNAAIREHFGIGEVETAPPRSCPICGRLNPSDASECRVCRRPLTAQSATKLGELRDTVNLLAELKEKGKLDRFLDLAKKL